MTTVSAPHDAPPASFKRVQRWPDERARLEVSRLRLRAFPNRELTFGVRRGEVLALCGDQTHAIAIARALCGVEPALSGQVSLDGETLDCWSVRGARRSGIAQATQRLRGVQRGTNVLVVMPPTLPFWQTLGFVQQASQLGAATLLVSNDFNELLALAERALAFHDGALTHHLAASQISREALAHALRVPVPNASETRH